MKLLGVEFAPLNIPLERRLQTIGAIHYAYMFFFFGLSMLSVFMYLLLAGHYLIILAYLAWYLHDRHVSQTGGRRKEWFRRAAAFRWLAAYFPLKLVKTSELDPSKNYILACHPHGVTCASHFTHFSTEGSNFSQLFPGIKSYMCTLSGQFRLPIVREYILMTGLIEVSRASIEWVLTMEGTGNTIAIMIGGAVEALEARPGNFKLKILSRKGFCKLALKHGASLVPVYAFGENDLYEQVSNDQGTMLRRLQNFVTQSVGFSPPLFHGRGIFNYTLGVLPFRKPVTTVVGAPLDVTKVEEPTVEQVNELHTRYCQSLVELFESNKLKYGCQESDHLELQ